MICTGTACYIKGVPQILDAIQSKFDIGIGDTTEDGNISLLSARCVGSCGLAPVGVFDGEVAGKLTPEKALEIMERWTEND